MRAIGSLVSVVIEADECRVEVVEKVVGHHGLVVLFRLRVPGIAVLVLLVTLAVLVFVAELALVGGAGVVAELVLAVMRTVLISVTSGTA